MNLQYLNYFYTIAKAGSFMKAAEELDYAQSNLSARIKQLEKETGAELFVRTKNGITLTDKGAQLLPYAERLLSLAREAESVMSSDELRTGSLRIGAMESAAVSFLPSVLTAFHQADPEIRLTVSAGTTRALLNRLEKHELDCAFVSGSSENQQIEFCPVRKEELVMLTESLPVTGTSWKELLCKPLLVFPYGCSYRQRLEAILSDQGLFPSEIIEFTSLGAILASASAGLGIALLPSSAVSVFAGANRLSSHPLPPQYGAVEISLAFRKNDPNRTLQDFIRHATSST